jgi:hypothetical protein
MTKPAPIYHENWYRDEQLTHLAELYKHSTSAPGCVIEIGCWEGKSTVALANACAPDLLIAVDTWAGNIAESPNHPSVISAKERDVFAVFCHNIATQTPCNVLPLVTTSADFFKMWRTLIRFIHIDASHDYPSVKTEIESALKHLAPGGIVCGDDILTSPITRKDLQGGVERAVKETLPKFNAVGNLWWWQKPQNA